MNTRETCPGCGESGLTVFFEMPDVPVLVNVLYATRESARGCPRGDIALGLCEQCGLISNLAFDPSRLAYEEGYENPLHYSEVFNAYSQELAEGLVERFSLRGKKLVEIGCGEGTFLDTLCKIGGNRGTGFDPSYPASLPTRRERFEVIRDEYSEKYAGVEADFFCSRHTLEHIPDPKALLRAVRSAMGRRTDVAVYVEVPNASHTLNNCFVWDIIYEHPSYFTSRSIARVIEMSGLEVIRTYEAFSGQYLCAEAAPPHGTGYVRTEPGRGDLSDTGGRPAEASPAARGEITEMRRQVGRFAENYRAYVERWNERLDELGKAGKRPVVWGVGSKGVTFLNVTNAGDTIDCVVDVNPKKQGKFVAGCGYRIVEPSHLRRLCPDVVIVANPVYREEVEQAVRALDLTSEVVAL